MNGHGDGHIRVIVFVFSSLVLYCDSGVQRVLHEVVVSKMVGGRRRIRHASMFVRSHTALRTLNPGSYEHPS